MTEHLYYIVMAGSLFRAVYGSYDTRDDALSAFVDAYTKWKPSGNYGPFDGYHDYYIVHGLVSPIGDDMELGDDKIAYEAKNYND